MSPASDADYVNDYRKQLDVVDGLVRMVGTRDRFTAEHLDAVGALSTRLARALDFDDDAVQRIALAARLHDVGKNTIPLHVIQKDAPLSAAEWLEMKLHPHYGSTIIEGFPNIAHLAPIVRAHHERMDGLGYPDGLVGVDIPIEARIIAVADAWHAMTAMRVYSKPRSPGGALDELVRCSGAQFDGEIVDAFLTVVGAGEREHVIRERDEEADIRRIVIASDRWNANRLIS
jgi:HD-GYP domain-containing protein (c-di-GMP phosphodiesterase class II)